VSLTPGTRLGAYEITAHIGVGGMGEVWCATDTNLGRQVAIKILPDAFAQDSDRLARFEREAKILASLNHPNIAGIYGLEKADGIRALVMELVAGQTLSDRIVQGPISLDDAVSIARQIAEALEAAHEEGIVHRDLKPANIKVRSDGVVKVLDFGLAKSLEPPRAQSSLSMSPTITSPAITQTGVILGTAAYMSPEQARGKEVDERGHLGVRLCAVRNAHGEAGLPRRRHRADRGQHPGERARLECAAGRSPPGASSIPPPLPSQGLQAARPRHRRRAFGDRGGIRCRSASQ
jgi:serine/threonine protein kinase